MFSHENRYLFRQTFFEIELKLFNAILKRYKFKCWFIFCFHVRPVSFWYSIQITNQVIHNSILNFNHRCSVLVQHGFVWILFDHNIFDKPALLDFGYSCSILYHIYILHICLVNSIVLSSHFKCFDTYIIFITYTIYISHISFYNNVSLKKNLRLFFFWNYIKY